MPNEDLVGKNFGKNIDLSAHDCIQLTTVCEFMESYVIYLLEAITSLIQLLAE